MKNSHKKNIIQVSVLFIIFLIVLPSNAVFAEISRPIVLNKISSSNLINQKIENNNIPMRGEEAIYYYNSVNDIGIGIDGEGTFEAAIKLTSTELADYNNYELIAGRFYHHEDGTHSIALKIYDQNNQTNPGTLLAEELYNITGEGWKRLNLTLPINLNITRDIWISFEITQEGAEEYPISTDEGPAVDGKGDMIYINSKWGELQDFGVDYDLNWNIEGIVSGALKADAGGPYIEHVNDTLEFHGSVTGGVEPYNWSWDFGDGTNSTIQNPNHTYNKTGNYTVSLMVEDAAGDFDIDNTTAIIVPEGTDITPPETNCTLDGKMTEEGVYIKNVTVTLTAFDNESGVNFTKYKLNDGTYTAYAEPFILTEEGNYTLYFYSVDNASNEEEKKSCTFSIEPPKTELGINISKTEVIIKNIGDENATDVVWSVDIKGGIFGLTDEHIDGNISNLAVGVKEVVDLPPFFCFGRVEIVAAADATSAKEVTEVANGFMIFFFILGIRNF